MVWGPWPKNVRLRKSDISDAVIRYTRDLRPSSLKLGLKQNTSRGRCCAELEYDDTHSWYPTKLSLKSQARLSRDLAKNFTRGIKKGNSF